MNSGLNGSGGGSTVQADVRIVSSSARNLNDEIKAGRLREDLYHRLNVVPIRAPSLAERREDIPELVGYFMQNLARAAGLPVRQVGDDAVAALQAYDWPGNVRELRNNVERLLILSNDGERGNDYGRHAAPRYRRLGVVHFLCKLR